MAEHVQPRQMRQGCDLMLRRSEEHPSTFYVQLVKQMT